MPLYWVRQLRRRVESIDHFLEGMGPIESDEYEWRDKVERAHQMMRQIIERGEKGVELQELHARKGRVKK